MTHRGREVRLDKVPRGVPGPDSFLVAEVEVGDPADGELLVCADCCKNVSCIVFVLLNEPQEIVNDANIEMDVSVRVPYKPLIGVEAFTEERVEVWTLYCSAFARICDLQEGRTRRSSLWHVVRSIRGQCTVLSLK